MNEFDHFMKHDLKVKHYVRYTDDFIVVSERRGYLESILPKVSEFLERRLKLALHPKKITIRPLHQGIDFLGYIIFSKYRLVRTRTRRRMFAKFKKKAADYQAGKINKDELSQSLQSYLGVLSHASSHAIEERFKNQLWFG